MSYPTIELEAGKRYLTRAGEVVGPLAETPHRWYPFFDPASKTTYARNGRVWLGEESRGDLVAVVADGAAPRPTAESVLRSLVERLERDLDDTTVSLDAIHEQVRTARVFLDNQPKNPMPLQLEIGKRYVTRDGQVTSPVRSSGNGVYPYAVDDLLRTGERELYTDCGRWGFYLEHRLDLVSEYVEETQPSEPNAN